MSRIRQIIQEYFQNNYSSQIQNSFISWLKTDKDKDEKEEAIREIWDNLSIQPDSNTEKSYLKLYEKIGFKKPNRKVLYLKIAKVASILLLPLLSILFTYLYMSNQHSSSNMELVEYIVPNGENRTITLPDSSTVLLNGGSIIIYPKQFNQNKRDIFLNGEALFSVCQDKNRPFIVKTTDLDVEVLGTVFNVSSYTDSETSSATLKSGKVNVHLKSDRNKSIILAPNEQLVYNRLSGTIDKKTVDITKVLAWTEGNIIIQGMSMEEIAKTLERRYGVAISYNSFKFHDVKVTMKFVNGETLVDCMEVLKFLVPNLKYKIEDEKLYIY